MSKLSVRWTIALAILASLVLAVAGTGQGGPVVVSGQPDIKVVPIDPWQDTYSATSIELPLGKAANLRAGHWGAEFATFMQFDFPSELGEGATIVSARFSIYCHQSEHDNDQPTALELSRVMSKWSEDTLIHKKRPNVSGPKIRWTVEPCYPKDDPKYNPGWRHNDEVTDIVRRWYSGELENFGWQLAETSDVTDHRYTFYSRDGQPPQPLGFRPKLTIRWTGGTTATFTPSATPTTTPTLTPSVTPTPTMTLTPSLTPTITNTPENTLTPTPTPTPTARYAYLPITLNAADLDDTSPPALPTSEVTQEPPTEEATPAEPTDEPMPSEEPTDEPTSVNTTEPTQVPLRHR